MCSQHLYIAYDVLNIVFQPRACRIKHKNLYKNRKFDKPLNWPMVYLPNIDVHAWG